MKTVEEMLKDAIAAEQVRQMEIVEAEQVRLQGLMMKESELEDAVRSAEVSLETLWAGGDANWTLPEEYIRMCVRYFLFESGLVDPCKPRTADVLVRCVHNVWNGLYAVRRQDYQFRLGELVKTDWEYSRIKGGKKDRRKLPKQRDLCALTPDEVKRIEKVAKAEVFPPNYRREAQAWIGSTGLLHNVAWQVRKGGWSVMPDFRKAEEVEVKSVPPKTAAELAAAFREGL
jgi:hypothetical protein